MKRIMCFFLFVFVWCSQSIAAPKNAAILGFGSLIWNPGDLGGYGSFVSGGPVLPLSFSRISQDGRMTLVVDTRSDTPDRKPSNENYPGEDKQTNYLLIDDDYDLGLDDLISLLRKREGTTYTNIDYVNTKRKTFRINQTSPRTAEQITVEGTYSYINGDVDIDAGGKLRRELIPYLKNIIRWADQKNLKFVVWTGLIRNFELKTGKQYSLAAAKAHFDGLTIEQQKKALEYIQKAPISLSDGNKLKVYLQQKVENIRGYTNENRQNNNNANDLRQNYNFNQRIDRPQNRPAPYVVPQNNNNAHNVGENRQRLYHEQRHINAAVKAFVDQGKLSNDVIITDVKNVNTLSTQQIVFLKDGNRKKIIKISNERGGGVSDPKNLRDRINYINQLANQQQKDIPRMSVSQAIILIPNVVEASLQDVAKGEPIRGINILRMNDEDLKKMFKSIGRKIGNLDRILIENNLPLLEHPDGHTDNMFFDLETGDYTWIDIDDMDINSGPQQDGTLFESEFAKSILYPLRTLEDIDPQSKEKPEWVFRQDRRAGEILIDHIDDTEHHKVLSLTQDDLASFKRYLSRDRMLSSIIDNIFLVTKKLGLVLKSFGEGYVNAYPGGKKYYNITLKESDLYRYIKNYSLLKEAKGQQIETIANPLIP